MKLKITNSTAIGFAHLKIAFYLLPCSPAKFLPSLASNFFEISPSGVNHRSFVGCRLGDRKRRDGCCCCNSGDSTR